jgi:cutinase
VSINCPSPSSTRRGWSKSLKLTSAALLGAGLLVNAPAAAPPAKADNCPDVALTFARGTDEPKGLGRVGQALADGIKQVTGKNVDAYPVDYRATLLQIHGNDGAKDAIKHIKDVADKCPNTPQVLGGYSQGASVVDIVTGTQIGGVGWGDSLPQQYASHIIAVTTFGNPADRSGGTISAQSAMFGAKAVDYCNPEDPICHAGQGNEWKGHTDGYVPVYTSQAASFVATRLLSVIPQTGPDGSPLGLPPGPGPYSGQPGPMGPMTPGQGPAPGPVPMTPGPTVVDQTQPASFH